MPAGILTTSDMADAHLEFGMRLFYDDIPENTDVVQGILDNDVKGLVVTAREADWNKLPDDFQKKFKRLTVPLFSDDNVSRLAERMFDFLISALIIRQLLRLRIMHKAVLFSSG